jgi:hypothetical protein
MLYLTRSTLESGGKLSLTLSGKTVKIIGKLDFRGVFRGS